jgi:pilus assembly protein Flp/PilA
MKKLLTSVTLAKVSAGKFLRKYLFRTEEGATLAEYGLLLALIAVVCLVAIKALGGQISAMFQSLSTSI